MKIDRDVSNEKVIIFSKDQSATVNKISRKSFPGLSSSDSREARVGIEPDIDSYGQDFISVHRSPARKRKLENEDQSSSTSQSEDDRTLYAPIEEGSKKATQPSDLDLVDTNFGLGTAPPEEHASIPENGFRRQSIELSRQLNANLSDSSAWLKLIELQDHMFGLGKDCAASTLTAAERQSNADVKISMYEKALGKVGDPQGRETLMLGMMDEGSRIWNSEKLSRKWQTTLRDNPTYRGLWKHYLDFQQTTFSSFRLEGVTYSYLNCFSVLRHARSSSKSLKSECDAIVESQIYAILRMSTFMREGGFSEHAVAVWQAILEYNLCRPCRLKDATGSMSADSTSKMLLAFGEFWDSEVPRIGEVDAKGWAGFDSGSAGPPAFNKDTKLVPVDTSRIFESWAKQEHLQALQSRLPARTTDDVEEDDPRRVILFSDIQDILIDLETSSARDLLIQAFLFFCNLPSLPTEDDKTYSTLSYRDSFLRNETVYGSHNSLSSWQLQLSKHKSDLGKDGVGSNSGPFNSKAFDHAVGFCLVDYQVASDTLFAGQRTWFSALESWQRTYSSDEGPVKATWIHRVLRIIVDIEVDRTDLAELLLAFELRISPHTVRKTAKNLIKKQPSNLRLYNAYSLIEYRLGKVENAEKAMAAAINMTYTPSSPLKRGLDAVYLWRTWIWELLDSGKSQQALVRLLRYGDREITVNSAASEAIKNQSLPKSPIDYQRTQEVRKRRILLVCTDVLQGIEQCPEPSHIWGPLETGNIIYGASYLI